MKKTLLGLGLAGLAVFGLASCDKEKETTAGGSATSTVEETKSSKFIYDLPKVEGNGKKLNIYCWNEEFRGFFNRYSSDEGKALLAKDKLMDDNDKLAKEGYHYEGYEVVWHETPNAENQYQDALDAALAKQSSADENNRVDLFLAEADYISKYADSASTMDISTLVPNRTNIYKYTEDACSDKDGKVKGVSFQCCPAGMIYNRKIAKAVLGTDDPVEVQKKVSDWDKFDAVAAQMKAAGYYMIACEADTYRVFSNNATEAWVAADGTVTIPAKVNEWLEQADKYVENGWTIPADVWSDEKVENVKAGENGSYAGKAFCCFGPAWYYNFCLGQCTPGDWALCEGPASFFWGGTWLMAPAGTARSEVIAKILNQYINDTTTLELLIKNESQFTNSQTVNKAAADAGVQNAFLGGQNDTALYCELAKTIKFAPNTYYDQACNEQLQGFFREYLKGDVTKATAIDNFETKIKELYPNVKFAD